MNDQSQPPNTNNPNHGQPYHFQSTMPQLQSFPQQGQYYQHQQNAAGGGGGGGVQQNQNHGVASSYPNNYQQHQQSMGPSNGSMMYGIPPPPPPQPQQYAYPQMMQMNSGAPGYPNNLGGGYFYNNANQAQQGMIVPPPPPLPPPQRRNQEPSVAKPGQNKQKNSNVSASNITNGMATKSSDNTSSTPTNTTTPDSSSSQKQEQTETKATEYKCEPCNVSFPTQIALQNHISSHITCSHPNCNFTASKKVVNAHRASNHNGKYSGRGLKTVSLQFPGSKKVQKFKICVGNHPEDIQAWIAERKKRFPTRGAVKKKEEREKRQLEEGALVNGMVPCCKKIKMESDGGGGDDDEKKVVKTNTDSAKTVVGDGAVNESLTNLMAGYSSSSDSDNDDNDDETKKQPTEQTNLETQNTTAICTIATTPPSTESTKTNYKTLQCRYFLRNGKCKNGDSCTYIHDQSKHEEFKANRQIQSQLQSQKDKSKHAANKAVRTNPELIAQRRDQKYDEHVRKLLTPSSATRGGGSSSGNTLLRKLLENDLKRERSMTLQILRYIVDCNYFQNQRSEVNDCADNDATMNE